MLGKWRSLTPGLEKYAPQLVDLPTPGDLSAANVEEVLRLKPDVVFVTNYAPPAMIEQLSNAGLPVVAISLSKGEGIEVPKLNPTFADDDIAYSEGLKAGVQLIGDIVGERERADRLVDCAFEQRELVEERVKAIPDAERVLLSFLLGRYPVAPLTVICSDLGAQSHQHAALELVFGDDRIGLSHSKPRQARIDRSWLGQASVWQDSAQVLRQLPSLSCAVSNS